MANIVGRMGKAVRYRFRKGLFGFIAPQFEKNRSPLWRAG